MPATAAPLTSGKQPWLAVGKSDDTDEETTTGEPLTVPMSERISIDQSASTIWMLVMPEVVERPIPQCKSKRVLMSRSCCPTRGGHSDDEGDDGRKNNVLSTGLHTVTPSLGQSQRAPPP